MSTTSILLEGRQGFEASYREHSAVVYRTALRIVGNHYEAEDVTQGVFLKVWADPAAFRGGNKAAWLTTVAHNHAIDVLRRRRTTLLGEVQIESLRPALTAEPDKVEDIAIGLATRRALRDAIATLAPRERMVVLDSFVDGRSHEQIAQIRGLPLGTVKTRIRQGLRRLRPALLSLR
ncbi:MAG: RNA polymerase sigma factor [Candidatus Eremiobacteraeota bacterium]|nr:RNA polymerase sigma factor [Candidatus Eremiobacteraeota bacterium]